MENKTLIVQLIREDLRNKRLTCSLEDIGFDCSYYMLNISTVILELAGYKTQTDAMQEWYVKQTEKAMKEITFANLNNMLDKWSKTIGDGLLTIS